MNLPPPPAGAAQLELGLNFVGYELEVAWWFYAPRFQTDQAGAISWVDSIVWPYLTDLIHNNFSSLLTVNAYRLSSWGSAFWSVEVPTVPLHGTVGPTCPAHSCVDFIVGIPAGGRRGHSIQHFPGLFAGDVDNGRFLTDPAWAQMQHDAGALFNGAFQPSISTSPEYLATLSRVSAGVPRPSALLLPATSYSVSRRVGTMRRRMRT